MTKTIGAPRYTYSPEEVIEFRDDEHTPYTSRKEATLAVEFRAPEGVDWVSIQATETTKTATGSSSRVISFSMPREQFDAVVAHVNRGGSK